MTWFIAFLGIAISFLVKFGNRKDKKTEPSLWFWAKDNYSELLVSLLSMVMLLIIFNKTEFNNTYLCEKFRWITSVPMDLISAALAGYLNNALWYLIVKKAKGK